MPAQTKQLLDDLQSRTGAGSTTETIRRAIDLYNVVTQELARGGVLYVEEADGQRTKIVLA